ncbi:hypothetical protein A8F94_09760 [Bacillus sp. FJAT-27225]|uniref:DUF4362 domain-containing protein n=1 Tax=Bacillus sp. FJAT-27225 TaxID=1743144 RepID=UPI00080C2979|nr:DUF4362 domain-containing protein [Bacillus sp. FJAT-27225]OCA88095.1 hypothetical protein A8F94_09760 [Bacillus sp. FJAT-27225]
MKNLLICTIVIVLGGCDLFVSKVVNNHGTYENLLALDEFAADVEKGQNAELRFIEYGVEGQEGVRKLKYNKDSGINVHFSVDGEEISTYMCEGIKIDADDFAKRYILTNCSGRGDQELLVLYAK